MLHLGDFVALFVIRRLVSWIFLVWSFAGHGDQDGCAYVLRADILLEIPRVHVSRQVQVSRPSLGRGWFQVLVWTQVSTALGDFVTLRLTRGCALGLLEASVLGSKTSSPYGKVS